MFKNKWALWTGLVVAPVIVATVALYFLLFDKDSPEELRLESPVEVRSKPDSHRDFSGRWRIDSGSVVGYRVREKLARLPAPSDAVGRTSDIQGEFTVATKENDLIISGATVEVDMGTLRSDENRRDNRLRTTGLETDRFPTARFLQTDPVAIPQSDAAIGRGSASITGDLTLHGVTKRVTIPLDIQLAGENIEVAGAKIIVMADFGITPPDVAGIVTVEPSGTLEFKLILAKL